MEVRSYLIVYNISFKREILICLTIPARDIVYAEGALTSSGILVPIVHISSGYLAAGECRRGGAPAEDNYNYSLSGNLYPRVTFK